MRIANSAFLRYKQALLENARSILHRHRLGFRSAEPIKLSPSGFKVLSLLHGFIEIDTSLEVLNDAQFFFRQFPFPRWTKITRSRYIRFVVEGYLNETYILSQRLSAYPQIIRRALARKDESERYKRMIRDLQGGTQELFANLQKARGGHVHHSRFQQDELKDLEFYDVFAAEGGIDPQWRRLSVRQRTKAYEQACKRWVTIIRNNNKTEWQWVEAYFALLYDYVFDSDGKIIGIAYPTE